MANYVEEGLYVLDMESLSGKLPPEVDLPAILFSQFVFELETTEGPRKQIPGRFKTPY
jgi:hypothetical protein